VPNKRSIILENVHLVPSAKDDAVVCDLYVEGKQIVEIDPSCEQRVPTDERINCSNHVAIPGLANLHVHCRPERALSDGMPVPEWHRRVDLVSRNMSPDDALVGGLVAFGELLMSGATTVVVMTRLFNAAAEAAELLGIRAFVVPLAGDGGGVERGDLDDLHDSLKSVESHSSCNGRVQLWPGFDSPLTTSLDGMRKTSATAHEMARGIHTHMAETEYEVATFEKKRGVRELEALRSTGVLGERTLLAHCNWLTDEDLETLAETATSVVHNPTSNMRFASGVCRVLDLSEVGVPVALGTDGMLSGYQLNMFEAMRTAAKLQRITSKNAAVLGSSKVLSMSTSVPGSILATGAGMLTVGSPADITVIEMTGLHLQPYRRDPVNDRDLLNLIVWCAHPSDVQHVICSGDIVVRDRHLTGMREEEIRRRAVDTDKRLRPLIS
jgi:5-methylthioadenosine/S-adenosylhomocysteine deaminase